MRIKTNQLRNMSGETRIVEKSLWFPKKIDDEWRWLEKAKFIQKVESFYYNNGRSTGYQWANMRWKD